MALVMTSAPALEPVTVEEAKEHLRVDGTHEDVLISSLIVTSRLHIEAALGLSLVSQAWKLVLDAWPMDAVVNIPMRPVIAVNTITVFAADGSGEVIEPANYVVDLASSPPRIATQGATWPKPMRAVNGIEIDFVAGYGAMASDVPAPIRHALMLLVAHWYEHRDPIEIGSLRTAIPDSVSQLLKPFRMVRL